MEKKYTLELAKEELRTLQTAMLDMRCKYAAARDAEMAKADKKPSKSSSANSY